VSTSADGIRVARSCRGVIIRDCYLEGMHDDCIAIHEQYSIVLGTDANASTVTVASQCGTSMYTVG
jgi:polygalacturonase